MASKMHQTDDALHVSELIAQGSSEKGLAAARETARAAWKRYPTNGCAAHLSALLQQAGIPVPMTLGAEALATVLKNRGWRRIEVTKQTPGDVGVCLDNDQSIPGADHIYLVITVASDGNSMTIADNQNWVGDVAVNAPHGRKARGGGRTPTDYFLRA